MVKEFNKMELSTTIMDGLRFDDATSEPVGVEDNKSVLGHIDVGTSGEGGGFHELYNR